MNKFKIISVWRQLLEGNKEYLVYYVYDVDNNMNVTLCRSPALLPYLTKSEAVRVQGYLESIWHS